MKTKQISLRKLFVLIFVLFSLVVVGVVVFTTNILLKNEFIHYVDQTHGTDVKEIAVATQKHLEGDVLLGEGFDEVAKDYIEKGFIITIAQDDEVLYDAFENSATDELQKKYKDVEEKMFQYFDSSYAVYEKELQVKNEEYKLEVYIYRPAFLNDGGFQHLDSLNRIFIYVGAITLSIALMIGFWVSRMLVKPLEVLVEKIKNTKNGEFASFEESSSRIVEYQKLEDSFFNLSVSLNNQKQMRKNLSADLSHELRTPLTAVSLMLENVEEGVWSMDEQMIYSLLEEVKRMQYLIEDIHKLEQVEANLYNLELAKIDIEAIVKQTIGVFEATISQKKIKIHLDFQQQTIRADKYRMAQVITNIVSNAIKYTNDEGTIEINTMKHGDSSVISIKDDGIGISKNDQRKVFQRFYRSSSDKVTREVGLGIGLTISKEIIHAHNGQMLLFSSEDKGTEVIIVLNDK